MCAHEVHLILTVTLRLAALGCVVPVGVAVKTLYVALVALQFGTATLALLALDAPVTVVASRTALATLATVASPLAKGNIVVERKTHRLPSFPPLPAIQRK